MSYVIIQEDGHLEEKKKKKTFLHLYDIWRTTLCAGHIEKSLPFMTMSSFTSFTFSYFTLIFLTNVTMLSWSVATVPWGFVEILSSLIYTQNLDLFLLN